MCRSRSAIQPLSRWGRWTVQAPYSGGKHPRWLSHCVCGVERPVHADSLLNGRSRSCGCLRSEMTAARNRVRSTYLVAKSNPEVTQAPL
jgi:hypothetical protein